MAVRIVTLNVCISYIHLYRRYNTSRQSLYSYFLKNKSFLNYSLYNFKGVVHNYHNKTKTQKSNENIETTLIVGK